MKSIKIAAKAYGEYRGFSQDLCDDLTRAGVELDDAANSLAIVLRGFLEMPKSTQNKILVTGAMEVARND